MATTYTADGAELMLPAFSSVHALVAVLGQDQPWVCVPLKTVDPGKAEY